LPLLLRLRLPLLGLSLPLLLRLGLPLFRVLLPGIAGYADAKEYRQNSSAGSYYRSGFHTSIPHELVACCFYWSVR
jgi:hypothetical protein